MGEKPEKDAKLRQLILQVLSQSEGPLLTPDVLKTLLDCGEQFTKTTINCALYHMKATGLIERIETQPPGWRLPVKSSTPAQGKSPPTEVDVKRRSQSCTSEEDVDNFELTPVSECSVNPFLSTDPQKSQPLVVDPSSRSNEEPHSSQGLTEARSLSRSPQRDMSVSQILKEPVPSPFFPTGYGQANPLAMTQTPKTPALADNSHNPMPESQFAYRHQAVPAVVTPSPKPSFAAVVKSDPWAATAVSVTPPNFGASIRSAGKPAVQKMNSQTFNRFDAEFGDAPPDFSHQAPNTFSQQTPSFPQQTPSFSQQTPSFTQQTPSFSQPSFGQTSNSFTPKLPKFSFASKPSSNTQHTPAQPATPSFSQQKRKNTSPNPQDLTPSQNSFGKRPTQQTEGFGDEPPDGGGSGKCKWFQLSGKKRVTVEYWKGQPLVSIREYYLDNGVPKPGKKGVSLTIEQWVALKGLVGSVDAAVKELAGL